MIMVSLCNSLSLFQMLYFYFIALACSFAVWDKCENCFPDGQYCTQTPNECHWHFITKVWKDVILTIWDMTGKSFTSTLGWNSCLKSNNLCPILILQNNHMYWRTSVTCNLWNDQAYEITQGWRGVVCHWFC